MGNPFWNAEQVVYVRCSIFGGDLREEILKAKKASREVEEGEEEKNFNEEQR